MSPQVIYSLYTVQYLKNMPQSTELTCTVKRVDEVVRHPHLVTQDQNTQASNKVSDIPEENFTINIELFRQTFTLPRRHALFLIKVYI